MVSAEPGAESRQEAVGSILVGNVNRFKGVREEEGIQHHHDRQIHPFRQAERLERGVQGFLTRFTVKLDPPGVALGETVGLIGPNIPTRERGPG